MEKKHFIFLGCKAFHAKGWGFCFMILIFFPLLLFPHDLWMERQGETFVLFYGHRLEEKLKYDPDYVKDILCKKGEKIEKMAFEKVYPVRFQGACDEIFLSFSSGYWTKTVYGTKHVSKDKAEHGIKSWLSIESVKFIHTLGIEDKPMTKELEIVPISDLSKVRKGKKLRLKVWFKGKPIKDVVVSYFGKPRGMTDGEGKIHITLRKGGLQAITATYKEKGDGKKADEIIHTTHLNFYLKD